MKISDQKMGDFIEMYRKKTGSSLTCDEALSRANTLVRMVEILYKPIKKSDYNALHSDSLLLPYKTAKIKKSNQITNLN